MSFYADQEIKPQIAKISYMEESVILSDADVAVRLGSAHADVRRAGQLITEQPLRGNSAHGEAYKVVLLSPATSEETLVLGQPARNDKIIVSGKPWGWTLGQR